MLRALIIAALALGAWSVPRRAEAAPLRGKLVVLRAAGAERCPDEPALRALVEAVAGAGVLSSEGEPEVVLEVRITASKPGFVGVVSASGARTGTRTIEDAGSDCSVLGGALAITIALLLEGGAEAPIPPPPEAPVTPWHRRTYLLPAIDAPPAERTRRDDIPPLTGSVGAIYDAGRLDGSAGGLSLGVDAFPPYVSVGLALLSLPEDPLDVGPFEVKYRYLGVRLRACSRQPTFEQFGIGICSGMAFGERHGKVVDPDRGVVLDEQSGAYLGLDFHLDLSRRIAGPFGIYTDFGFGVPLLQDTVLLAIPGVPVKLATADEPVIFGLGGGVRFWLEKSDPE